MADRNTMRTWRRRAKLGLAALGLATLGLGIASASTSTAAPAPLGHSGDETGGIARSLAEVGIPVTRGAAAGYVPDTTCASCHAQIAASYSAVGMALSFARPSRASVVEDFTAPAFEHAPSRQRMRIERRGERLFFRRSSVDPGGGERGVFEVEVDWVLGSGHKARTYLYRTPDGALFQLPLAWYASERRWGMAPGYDRADHDGVSRRVRRECLVCHNAFPDVPAGSDAAHSPHLFPAELPEGTGCQRCHGPGSEHVWLAQGSGDDERIRAAIVNPRRLSPARRDDVCFQCHLQPLVALAGPRRFGRGDYSFRPGETLADYQALVDANEAGDAQRDRFEINHHAYRLRQSRCFAKSPDRLTCTTCHDPHRRVSANERLAHYRTACLTCHQEADCSSEHGAAALSSEGTECTFVNATSSPMSIANGHASAAPSDCVACHMPKRRPRDVVQVVMTDHRIAAPPSPRERSALTAPRVEADPVLTDIHLLEPDAIPAAEREIYRALPVARTGVSRAAVDRLEKLAGATTNAPSDGRSIAGTGATPSASSSWRFESALTFELGLARLRTGRAALAVENFAALQRQLLGTTSTLGSVATASVTQLIPPGRLLEALGLAFDGAGRPKEAEANLRVAFERGADPTFGAERAEVAARLARLVARVPERRGEAIDLLETALRDRPNLTAAWVDLGYLYIAVGQREQGIRAFGRALALEPRLRSVETARTRAQAERTAPGD